MPKNNTRRKSTKRIQQMRRRRLLHTLWLCLLLAVIISAIGGCIWFIKENRSVGMVAAYNTTEEFPFVGSDSDSQREVGFASDLCVGEATVALEGVTLDENQKGALLNLEEKNVLFSQGMYEKLYPASMTKIMTALLALENGTMDQIVTISQQAITLEAGSQVCGFQAGDKVSMKDLIYCLLVYSGNDAAAAIAETVGGSEAAFVEMMNHEAQSLGMTGTHFTNPHGLQDEDHYTTAYDIYLMLNEAMKNQDFLSIIQLGTYTAQYTDSEDNAKTVTLESTDHYLTGEATAPRGVTILGGKTGTTSEAGNCLALISQNAYGVPYVSVISNAYTKEQLYEQMNTLLSKINL